MTFSPSPTVLLALVAFAATSALNAGSGKDSSAAPLTTAPAADPFADRLSGDWGGLRTRLADHGIGIDVDSTHYYQGLLDGTGSKDWDYGGRLDAFVHLDTGKLGLWEGGSFHVHGEHFYGSLPPSQGGAALPTNMGVKLPQGFDNEWVASSIYFSQDLGRLINVRLGKINTVDLLANDLFYGGYGISRFQHLAFAAPVSGLTPPVIMGGMAILKTQPVSFSLMIYDPNDRTGEYWPDDLYDDGVNVSLGATWAGQIAGRTSSIGLTGIYSTKDKADLSQLLLPPDLTTGRKDDSWHLGVQLSHLLVESAAHPGRGWGLFLRAGFSDGNPNPYQSWVSGGIGGQGLLPSRPDDAFGLGYFYYQFSDDLQSTLNPLLNIDDEQGLEVFYNVAVTPWFHIGANLQVIDPAFGAFDTAILGGVRASIRF